MIEQKKKYTIKLTDREYDIIEQSMAWYQDNFDIHLTDLDEEQKVLHQEQELDTIEDYESAMDAFYDMEEVI